MALGEQVERQKNDIIRYAIPFSNVDHIVCKPFCLLVGSGITIHISNIHLANVICLEDTNSIPPKRATVVVADIASSYGKGLKSLHILVILL